MAKIGAIDFTNNVDYNRKKLIEHCEKNGIKVDDNASLDVVVDANSNIMVEQNQDKFKVEFLDIDCSEFELPQYVEKGGSATIPTEIPSFDSEYLEFIEWATPCGVGFDNVQFDMVCMPRYKTKYDETLGQRPTYLICYFDETTLSPTINLSTATNTYIDWGDGTEVQQATTSNAHTYTNAGIYTIKIYGDAYTFKGKTNCAMFNANTYDNALTKAYLGENANFSQYSFSSNNLKNIVFSKDSINIYDYSFHHSHSLVSLVVPQITSLGANPFTYCYKLQHIIFSKGMGNTFYKQHHIFDYGYNLKSIVMDAAISIENSSNTTAICYYCYNLINATILEGVTILGSQAFYNCAKLKTINLPQSLQTIGKNAFQNCSSLENIELPENIKTIEIGSFYGCFCLESLTIPANVTTFHSDAIKNCYALKKLVLPPSIVGSSINLVGCYSLQEIVLPNDFDNSFNIQSYMLSDNMLIYIANKLKDNSITGVTRTLTLFNNYQAKLNTIYLNEFDEVVPYGAEGAISLLQKIQNKNWTVSL